MGYQSFEALYEAYSAMVYWTAFGISHHHESAMDVTQTVFMQAFRHWDVIADLEPKQAKAWVWRAARNAGVDRLRKAQREVVVMEPPEVPDFGDTPEEALMRREQAKAVWQAVEALPKLYRQAVYMHYYARLSQKEAASALGISGGTYRSRLARARVMLEKGGLRDG